MENKYYIPDIEDFFIGYEYEKGIKKYGSPRFAPEIERWVTEIFTGYQDQDLEYLKHYGYLRVPYLTQEQVEAEGWKHTDDNSEEGLTTIVLVKKDELYNYRVMYNINTNRRLWLVTQLKSSSKVTTVFDGFCKSINEFRKIVKWTTKI